MWILGLFWAFSLLDKIDTQNIGLSKLMLAIKIFWLYNSVKLIDCRKMFKYIKYADMLKEIIEKKKQLKQVIYQSSKK